MFQKSETPPKSRTYLTSVPLRGVLNMSNLGLQSPLNKKISSQSPVGEAILGRRVGDEVTVNTPAGQQTYKVEKTA